MAFEAPAAKSPEVAGKEYAVRINDAVSRNDTKSWTDTMDSITKLNQQYAPDDAAKFNENLIGNVDLNPAGLYNTKMEMTKIDKDNNGKVELKEAQDYAKGSDANDFQKALTSRAILPNFDGIANNSHDRVFSSILRDSAIRPIDLDRGLENAAANRPKEKLTEEQVNERIAAPDFQAQSLNFTNNNFDAIDKSKDKKLQPAEVTEYAKKPELSALEQAYLTRGIAPNQETIANNSRDNKLSGLGVGDTDIRRTDLAVGLEREYAKPEVQAMAAKRLDEAKLAGDTGTGATKLDPHSKLMELATVRRGEGPFHSAERILKAAGGKHGIDEVKALSNALRDVFNGEKHGDIKDLAVKHTFITDKNFDKILKSVKNDAAREALRKLAAA